MSETPLRPADLAAEDDVLSPLDLQRLAPLPPPYDEVDAAALWKELATESAMLDGAAALALARPADEADEARMRAAFASGAARLVDPDDNWAFLQPLTLTLEGCVHCQTCADACPVFLGSGRQELYRPTYRSDVLRDAVRRSRPRRWWRRDGEPPAWEAVVRAGELAYRCTECRRCTQACPMMVDNALATRELRKVFSQELGVAPRELHAEGSVRHLAAGSSTGMNPAGLRDTVEFLDDEVSERVGFKVTTPVDVRGADILLIHNVGEMLSWPENPAAFAVVMQQAGVSWTLSSEQVAYDAVNYGLWYDDVQFSRTALAHAEIARRLGVKKIVIGECGHAHKALAVVADRLLGPDVWVERQSFAPFLADLVDSRALRLDPSRNSFPVTLHDPCNLARGMGLTAAPRRVLRAVAPGFVEMSPRGTENLCCGGGSGLALLSRNNMLAWRVLVSGRLKLAQVLEAFRETPGPETPKYLCSPCSNCKGQFRDLFRAYGVWERSRILYGGLAELVANALVDVRPGFIAWEFH